MICDVQSEYAEFLLRILMDRYAGEYRYHLFGDIDRMMEFAAVSEIDTLFVSEQYLEQAGQVRAQRKFVITESQGGKNIGEMLFTPVFRYQSAECIIRDLGMGREGSPCVREKKAGYGSSMPVKDIPEGLIGVYSPVHRIGKTKFALRLGRRIGEHRSVLYLNMEGYCGADFYFPDDGRGDLSDLLYCLRQERTDYGLKISSMAGQMGNMDYIRPMKNETDLRNVTGREWLNLLDLIADKCVYKNVILDLGDGLDGLYDILSKCVRVYTPYISDPAALAKVKQYEDNLRETGRESILNHTVKKLMQRKERNRSKDGD